MNTNKVQLFIIEQVALLHKDKYPQINIKLFNGTIVHIRREWNTFFNVTGFEFKEEYTTPKINFHKFDNEFWKLAQEELRSESINSITKQALGIIDDISK